MEAAQGSISELSGQQDFISVIRCQALEGRVSNLLVWNEPLLLNSTLTYPFSFRSFTPSDYYEKQRYCHNAALINAGLAATPGANAASKTA